MAEKKLPIPKMVSAGFVTKMFAQIDDENHEMIAKPISKRFAKAVTKGVAKRLDTSKNQTPRRFTNVLTQAAKTPWPEKKRISVTIWTGRAGTVRRATRVARAVPTIRATRAASVH
jgi:hypothetical protein